MALASFIITVLFKRPLSIPTKSYSLSYYQKLETKYNTPKLTQPCLQTSTPLSSVWFDDPTHINDPNLGYFTCSNLIKASAKSGSLPRGKQLHGYTVKSGLYSSLSIQNQILNVYVKCRNLSCAQNVFDEMSRRNLVSWNTVICGVVYGDLHLGISYFKTMLSMGNVGPDDITFNGLFRSCMEVTDVKSGRQLHGFVVKTGFDLTSFVGGSIVDLYAKCGLIEDARRAFDRVSYKDVVLWNVMIYCYVFNSMAKEAIMVLYLMLSAGVNSDAFTFTSLLSSVDLTYWKLGKKFHGTIIRRSFDLDVLVASSLLNMYVKTENINDARKVFDEMHITNVVSWTTMIIGYGRHGDNKEAMRLLKRMYRAEYSADELTFSSVLSSCANQSAISELKQVHSCTEKSGFSLFLSIANALINAYSNCGSISNASQCFSFIIEHRLVPDLVTWTSIINAYAFHGFANDAIELFEKILSLGVRPDGVAFLGVLSSCSHKGLINEGLHYFNLMANHYRIVPEFQHYTCLIDLVGRAGFVNEAYDVLTLMGMEGRPDVLGAFIGACKVHGNLGLAKWASEKLLALEPNKAVNYALMSNLYASEGQWLDVARTRRMMRCRCEYKVPGCSWVEISGKISTFVSNDRTHLQGLEVYDMLALLVRSMKKENHLYEVDIELEKRL